MGGKKKPNHLKRVHVFLCDMQEAHLFTASGFVGSWRSQIRQEGDETHYGSVLLQYDYASQEIVIVENKRKNITKSQTHSLFAICASAFIYLGSFSLRSIGHLIHTVTGYCFAPCVLQDLLAQLVFKCYCFCCCRVWITASVAVLSGKQPGRI